MMKMKLLVGVVGMLVLATGAAWGQFTAASGVVSDSAGAVYASCTYTATIQSSTGQAPTINGSPVPSPVTGTCNGSGVISASVADTQQVQPSGSKWRWQVIAAAGAPGFTQTLAISGASFTLPFIGAMPPLSSLTTVPFIGAATGSCSTLQQAVDISTGNAYTCNCSSVPCTNGTWVLSGGGGTGNVVGPGSSTANDFVTFGDTTGKLLSDSGVAKTSVPTASGSQTANTLATWTGSNVLGQTVSGINSTIVSGGVSFRKAGIAPADVFQGDNGGFQHGIDSAAVIPYRDYFIARNEGLSNLPLAATDGVYMAVNFPTSTLNGALSIGATSVVTNAALTMGTAISANQYIMLGTNTLGTQEVCIVTAGSGSTTLTVSNCENAALTIQAGTIYAHGNGELVSVINAKYQHPTLGVNCAGSSSVLSTFSLNLCGDNTNELGLGELRLLDNTGQTTDAIQLITTGNSYEQWTDALGDMSVNTLTNTANRTVSDLVTNTTTTITSATANFTYHDLYRMVADTSNTNIPKGDWIKSVTNSTTAVLNVAATGSASGLTATIDGCMFCVSNGQNQTPRFNIDFAGVGWFRGSFCYGDACLISPVSDLELRKSTTAQFLVQAGGTSNSIIKTATTNQSALTITSLGSGADNTTIYTNNTALLLGTNTTVAQTIDTSQNTTLSGALISGGTKWTPDSGCGTVTSTLGGVQAGSFHAAAVSCTVVITTGKTAPNGWACYANDLTTNADTMHQTATSQTTFTLSGTVVSGDVINFGCQAY